ncbi:YhjD/YihY/BrkB family envelope integrity protein [Jannaschia seohaensis]|uniref:Virulence factor BrkB n=1 Tax=Jannaschia seohaensis TaxID=475081 RepID=A0A2Y9B8N2_9RHOB|nr:YhjD/YihY/BrkB family envelope integrity protein [Jannaschia seohaensis]PWJ13253.1 virulence factor BrkB [Jannaschia seohaensis]SSA50579.1 Virulence factor BrkB [Jannaschia seohaensis]
MFPALPPLLSIAGLVLDPGEVVGALEHVSPLDPGEVSTILLNQATTVSESQMGGWTPRVLLGILAAAALSLWRAMSVGVPIYVGHFDSYNETFGSLAGVVLLLTWIWLSAHIGLIAAEVNAEMEAQTRHDTTVGANAPGGERGARKAGELGAAQ